MATSSSNLCLHVGYDSGYSRGTAPAFNSIDLLRPVYTGTLLAVGGFTKASGEAAIANGRADLIVYGRPFIANPDLVERFRLDASLNSWDVRTFYGGDDHGYTDYPTLINRVDYRDSMRIEHLGHFHKVKLYP